MAKSIANEDFEAWYLSEYEVLCPADRFIYYDDLDCYAHPMVDKLWKAFLQGRSTSANNPEKIQESTLILD